MAGDGARATRLLIATRFARSIGQGALAVDFSLYLKALGWSAVEISAILSGALIFGVLLTLIGGPLSDRGGRRRFILGYEVAQCIAAVGALFSANVALLSAAALVGGFGRGANGSAGPFAPVEQAWLAQSVSPSRRGPVYSLNAAVGFLGMAVGAVIAATPSHLHAVLPGALAFRPLFLLSAVGSLVCAALVLRTPDTEQMPARARPPAEPASDKLVQQENRLVRRLMLANVMNGIGIGATGPLISYWFALRFGEPAGTIGPLMALGFLVAALANLGAGRLTRVLGIVRSVVAMRIVGLALLIALPFAPTFGIAGALYVLRGMFNRGTAGARGALNISIVRAHRRGFSASMANVSVQVPRGVSPMLTGVLFAAGDLVAPFLIGAAFQGAYIALYYWGFRDSDPGRPAPKSRIRPS